MLKSVHQILNKMTPSKFDKLFEEIQALLVSTEDQLSEIAKLIFKKVG